MCTNQRVAGTRPRSRQPELPDRVKDDVVEVAREIHAQAKDSGLTLAKLAKRVGSSQQTFNNWKQGDELPKIGLLQAYAAAVGGRIRVILERIDERRGGTVVIPVGVGGDYLAHKPSEEEELSSLLDRLNITDPGIRRKAAAAARDAARDAAARTAIEELKTKVAHAKNPKQPTVETSPSRGRRRTSSGDR